jgi:gliding motility-associated-like protein
MNIFDRWGNRIFSSSDQTVGWPGTNKGADCPNDVYVYKIDYKGLDGKVYHKTGHVSINR